jgi:tRNA pseudouridine13 synthase
MDGNVVHIKSLKMPESSKKNKDADETPSVEASSSGLPEKADVDMTATMAGESSTAADAVLAPEEPKNLATATPEQPMDVKKPTPGLESVAPPIAGTNSAEAPEDSVAETPVEDSPWPERFTVALSKYMSDGVISQLKTMYLEGPEPPFVSDDGWASRPGTEAETGGDATVSRAAVEPEPESSGRGGRGRGRGGRGARGGRGGRGGARGGRPAPRIDNRKVLSDVRDPFLPAGAVVGSGRKSDLRCCASFSRSTTKRRVLGFTRRSENCSAGS